MKMGKQDFPGMGIYVSEIIEAVKVKKAET